MTEQEAIKILKSKLHLDCKIKEAIGELEAREVAVKALEKQIAKKPIFDDEHSFIRRYHCQECKCVVDAQRYCHHCGQKLDFVEE